MRAFATTASVILITLCSALLASARTITVLVGGNGTNKNPSMIFQPQEVRADVGDVVFFNFTNGTHSAIESTFAEPCIPIHDSNATLDGFYSGLRDTVNGSVKTALTVQVTEADRGRTFWFYDIWGCGQGGVGAINANDSDWENFGAFVRNAIRLNGTGSTSTSVSSFSRGSSTSRPSGTESQSNPTSTSTGNSAEMVGVNTVKAVSILTPLLLVMFAL